ncbi:MAG: KilA-N domain-containing protein, partial [Candidatus Saccharibacteria bacterium]|nr:KilA-N domain-containing protein [Candidatus Saccharibacteria bacterium]
MSKIEVMNTEISVQNVNGEDYISLTDMLKAKDGAFFI